MFFNGKYRVLKKMNYLSDQQGVIDRYLKEATGWASHLANTKKVILDKAENKAKGTCAILGSGWLLDIPLAELSELFGSVYLFDVIHPVPIKHKTKKMPNVHLVELDITGGAINEFFNSVQMHKSMKIRKEPADFLCNGFKYPIDFDYVVSVNIINQLDILLIDYIKTYKLYTEAELLDFRKKIQQKHIDTLPPTKSLLVTDFEELVYTGEVLDETKKLIHIELPKDCATQKWQWEFDHEDYIPGKNVIFNVLAMEI